MYKEIKFGTIVTVLYKSVYISSPFNRFFGGFYVIDWHKGQLTVEMK